MPGTLKKSKQQFSCMVWYKVCFKILQNHAAADGHPAEKEQCY